MDELLKKKRLLSVSYVATIFFAIHYFSLYFILSTYLNEYFSEGVLSVIFAVGSVLCIMATNFFGKMLKTHTNRHSLYTALIIQFLVTITLAFSNYINTYILIVFFLMHYVLYAVITTSINIFIEEFSDDENVGSIRGTVLTIYNFGALLSPFLSSQIFKLVGYSGLFIISALAVIPLIYIVRNFYKEVKEPKYKPINIIQSFKMMKKDKNIRGVIVSSFILNSFYAVVNVYLALYLIETLKMPVIVYLQFLVPITIIPFVLIPYQLGKYSDEIIGEKRGMLLGILIMSLVMVSIYLFKITTPNVLIWIILIFIARLGATITETENYTYFYKGVDSRSVGLISVFHNMVNVSFIFITVLGAILIGFFKMDVRILFLTVGVLGFLSIFLIAKIRDSQVKVKRIKKDKEKTEELLETEEESQIKEAEKQIKEQEEIKSKKVKIWA